MKNYQKWLALPLLAIVLAGYQGYGYSDDLGQVMNTPATNSDNKSPVPHSTINPDNQGKDQDRSQDKGQAKDGFYQDKPNQKNRS